jgi:hypothetical protein
MRLNKDDLTKEAVFTLLDVLDSVQSFDPELSVLGLPSDRCKAIDSLANELFAVYGQEWLKRH